MVSSGSILPHSGIVTWFGTCGDNSGVGLAGFLTGFATTADAALRGEPSSLGFGLLALKRSVAGNGGKVTVHGFRMGDKNVVHACRGGRAGKISVREIFRFPPPLP